MYILDRYIARKFLTTFFFTVLLFTLISTVIDVSDKIEEFISERVPIQEIVFDYYMNWIFWINGLLFPLYALIAVIFFTSRMAYRSEIISIFNAGVSFRRLMVSYLIPGGLIFGLHQVGSHFVIPDGNKRHFTFQYTYIDSRKDEGTKDNVHIFLQPGVKAFINNYNPRDTVISDLRLETIHGNRLTSILKAPKASWDGQQRLWRLENYELRSFSGLEESVVTGTVMDTALQLSPEDFVEYQDLKEMMDTPELLAYISKQQKRGARNVRKYQVEFHRRIAEPFTILILTLIGLAVASRKVRGGVGLHLTLGIGLGAVFLLLSRFSVVFAINQSLHPMLGVWLPNILFGIICAVLVRKSQK
jgi:lipopolysaccharide export system permease protein